MGCLGEGMTFVSYYSQKSNSELLTFQFEKQKLREPFNSYPGTLIFAAGAYTFYTVGSSIIDIVKYRKYKSPVLSAAKNIRFVAALVSLLSLETAMLAQFGNDEAYRFLMTLLTGSAVCLIVLGISVYMTVKANIGINRLKSESAD